MPEEIRRRHLVDGCIHPSDQRGVVQLDAHVDRAADLAVAHDLQAVILGDDPDQECDVLRIGHGASLLDCSQRVRRVVERQLLNVLHAASQPDARRASGRGRDRLAPDVRPVGDLGGEWHHHTDAGIEIGLGEADDLGPVGRVRQHGDDHVDPAAGQKRDPVRPSNADEIDILRVTEGQTREFMHDVDLEADMLVVGVDVSEWGKSHFTPTISLPRLLTSSGSAGWACAWRATPNRAAKTAIPTSKILIELSIFRFTRRFPSCCLSISGGHPGPCYPESRTLFSSACRR